MPELPEVESTARKLSKDLVGHTIRGVEVTWANMISGQKVRSFQRYLQGATFEEISLRGKYLVIQLSRSGGSICHLVAHLRMSGRMEVVPSTLERSPYDRIVFSLSGGKEYRFRDVRKFGRMTLVSDPNDVLEHLGPEPLSDAFSSQRFFELLQAKRGAIKPLLLNQSFIAGLGNIYVDESLWAARVHPLRPAHSITRAESTKLHRAIRRILQAAIDSHGTDFGDKVVNGGRYQPKVYGRSGERCPRCKTQVERIVVGQRGTHLCCVCQS